MAVVREKRYILAELTSNHNKWYRIMLHDDGKVITRWGRVGDEGCEKQIGSGEPLFDAKCREKEKKGYVEQRTLNENGVTTSKTLHSTNLEKVAIEQIVANTPEATALIRRLARANIHQILQSTSLNYNAAAGTFSTPLGIVTQEAIDEARRALTVIGDSISRGAYDGPQLLRAVNRFLNLVPQDIGRTRRNIRDLYPDLRAVQEKNDILDRLEASLQTALGDASADNPQGKLFEAKLHLIESRSEFKTLRTKFHSTLNRQHSAAHLHLKRAYRVEIAAMQRAFAAKSSHINHVMELWHGTGEANILSILKDGFRVRPPQTAQITGKLFGDGIYFGLQSTKSLNYSFGFWNGTRNKNCFLFLCDVAVGNYQVPSSSTSKRPARGYDSYWAKPAVSGVVNDEIVIFDEAQINPRYLLEFEEK